MRRSFDSKTSLGFASGGVVLACDDDYGTRAMVFTNERAAVNALLDELAVDVTFIGNERQELIDEYFDPDGDFYEGIAPYKSDMDTYSIDEHTLE
jgi:hypothetical protein